MIYDVPTRWMSAYDMMERAVYLRKAISTFVDSQNLQQFNLSTQEWDQVEYLLDLLLPIKRCNDRIEGTTRVGIDKVFWIYETLFNELDRLDDILEASKSADVRWIEALQPALGAMREKLAKYYRGTGKSFVYADAVIFNPRSKLELFKQSSWEDGDLEKYRDQCRKRYIEDYEELEHIVTPMSANKRSHDAMEDDDFDQMLSSLTAKIKDNEYDQYVDTPPLRDGDTLDVWRTYTKTSFPRLGRQVRVTLAVPATGAGVERRFSESGKVATKLRARMQPETVCDIMMRKDYLKRQNKP